MKVAVAGGTGLLGRMAVTELTRCGHVPVVLARSAGVDITSGAGLDAALRDVEVVIDVTNLTTIRKQKSVEFFTAGTSHLLSAGQRAGIRHHVVLSIVGVDRVDLGYYVGKRRQEQLALESDAPVSVLRATQFHEFPGQILAGGRGPALLPRMRTQPIAAREVAHALVELALGTAVGMAPELAGPHEEDLIAMARKLKRRNHIRRMMLPVVIPGKVGRALAGGGLLPLQDGPRGRQTFDEWLAETTMTTPRMG